LESALLIAGLAVIGLINVGALTLVVLAGPSV
jgi:hypothetical protein